MFVEKSRTKRFEKEAKAINRKAKRNGGHLNGRDAARLTKVKGSIIKYNSYEDEYDDDQYE